MVQAFDHRTASVVINPENLNRPAQPLERPTLKEHMDPNLATWNASVLGFGCQSITHVGPQSMGWTLVFKANYGAHQRARTTYCNYPSVRAALVSYTIPMLRSGNQGFLCFGRSLPTIGSIELLLRLCGPAESYRARA